MLKEIKVGFRTDEQMYGLSPRMVKGVAIAPMMIVCFFSLLLFLPETRSFARWMLDESRPVEWLQFALFILGSVLGWRLALNARKKYGQDLIFWFYSLLAVGLLFVSMEEVSWGQWIFGFEPPEAIRTVNKQHEFNFHNLPILHAVFEALRVFLGLSGLAAVWFFSKFPSRRLGVPFMLAPWFLCITLLALLDIPNYHGRVEANIVFKAAFELAEVLELLISAIIFLFLWLNSRISLRHGDTILN